MAENWKDEAANLPLWPGCTYYTGESPDDLNEVAQMPTLSASPGTFTHEGLYPGDPLAAPALDDPDTRAAFTRRLALRLGCPEEAANEGVTFYRGGPGWIIAAGQPAVIRGSDTCSWYAEVAPDIVTPEWEGWDDGEPARLVALVRAWRSVDA